MKLLRYGSVGPQVELLQLALQREGALREAPDGIFGPRTREAVTGFQRRSGLAADGVHFIPGGRRKFYENLEPVVMELLA